ncbi:MAG: hypothetical protein R3B13_08625 [Polyangiaceae bacterium]
MTRRDFYSLSRAVQERLLDSFHGRYAPLPILVRHGGRKTVVLWLALSVFGAALTLALWFAGFGNAGSALSLHAAPFAALFALGIGSLLTGLVCAAAHSVHMQSLPFPPGIYLFPACLVDARGDVMRVYPIAELSNVQPAGGSIHVQFGAARFALPVTDAALAPEAVARIQASAHQVQQADDKQIFELDPLVEPTVLSPLAPQDPLLRSTPIWIRLRYVLGAVTGLLLGLGLYSVRNSMSDERMFVAARHKDDVAAYESYLSRGQKHRAQVEQELLPRAKLRLAIAEGSVDAIDAFVKSHADSSVLGEAEIARRNALIAEFEAARKENTLAALLDYAARRPQHGMGAPFEQARHALYLGEIARYRKRAPEGSDLPDQVAKLIDFSEKQRATKAGDKFLGAAIPINFLRLKSETLNRADQAVSKNPMFNGVSSLPTRYFSDDKLAVHAKASATSLGQALSKGFNPEILRFEAGQHWVGDAETVEPPKAPRILVHYRVEWSGGANASKRPRGVFIGLYVFFKAFLEFPGEEPYLVSKYTASKNVPVDKLGEFSGSEAAGTAETALYTGMLKEAFSEAEEKHLGNWFAEAP